MSKSLTLGTSVFWVIPDNLDLSTFDFNWQPDPYDPPFKHQFGTQWQKTGGPRYVVPGATQVKYHDSQRAISLANPTSRAWRNISNISFDFSWTPDETEPPFIYQFGNQWINTGGPRYVVPGATQIKYMDSPKARALPVMDNWENYENYDFDFSWAPDEGEPTFIYQFGTQWQKTGGPRYVVPGATQIKYMAAPLARALPVMDKWVIPDNLDCSMFDFSWTPDEGEPPFIYQFGTQWQKTGGPRYVVPGATQIKYMYSPKTIIGPDRTNWVVIPSIDQSSIDFSWHPDDTAPAMNYTFAKEWSSGKEIATVSYNVPGATQIAEHSAPSIIKYKKLDIIFVSNGETGENARYQALCKAAGREVKWVYGVQGRERALSTAAKLSNTDWLLVFPAKLRVTPDFDFDWQPNRMIAAKHYIFYATNPVNDLEYGHMAAVGYNKNLVLATKNYGLDFTMSQPHDIIPLNSGTAEFNSDEQMTWRTAFREAIKLKVSASSDPASLSRLETWLSVAKGQFSEYSLMGAKHGVEYYDEVGGDKKLLQLTFSWDWLEDKFNHYFKNNK